MALNSAAENRRDLQRLTRLPLHNWQLRVDGDALITKNISNISPSGLSFKAPLSSDFKPGQTLKLTLSLQKDESFDCEGEVVWANSADDSLGSMRQLGVRFAHLPSRVDMAIMKEINDSLLLERRLSVGNGFSHVAAHRNKQKAKMTLRSIVLKTCGVFVLLAMTAALVTAVYLHAQAHPEDSIEYKFNQALIKKMMSNNNNNNSK